MRKKMFKINNILINHKRLPNLCNKHIQKFNNQNLKTKQLLILLWIKENFKIK